MPGLKLLEYDEDIRNKLCKNLNTNEETLDACVQELRDWAASEDQIPAEISDQKLEHIILLNKFNMPKAKSKLSAHFSLRKDSRYFKDTIIKNKVMMKQLDLATIVPMPKLLDTQRIFVVKILDPSTKDFDIHEAFAALTCQADLILEYDYHQSSLIVVDASNVHFGHIKQTSYRILSDFYKIFMDAFSGRIAAFHILNMNFAVRGILYLLRLVLKPKLANRIYVHTDMESLFKVIPKTHLPSDFGGDCISIKEVVDGWKGLMSEKDPLLRKLRNLDN